MDQYYDVTIFDMTLHCLLLTVYLTYIIFSLFRKTKMTFFQWIMLLMMILTSVNAVWCDISYTYYYYMCSFSQMFNFGIYCLLSFNILFLLSWQLYTATSDLSEFAIKGNLPSERGKLIKLRIY